MSQLITFLCHSCHSSNEPTEHTAVEVCDNCRKRVTHFILWDSPKEDAAAELLIERELALARGGFYSSNRAAQAMGDAISTAY